MSNDQQSASYDNGELQKHAAQLTPLGTDGMLWPDAEALQAQPAGDARYRCQVGSLNLLFDPAIKIEVLMEVTVHRMPHTPEWLLGVCNRRGDLVPVFDLHGLLGQGHARSDRRYLLVIDQGEHTVGFYINDYPVSVYSPEVSDDCTNLPHRLKPHVRTTWQSDSIQLLEIDHRQLFESVTRELTTSGALAREDLYQAAPEERN